VTQAESFDPDGQALFQQHRAYLVGIVYRMTGSLVDADDILQEAYLRWHSRDVGQIERPRAFLSRIVVRLCLDAQKSARSRRETYVGPWLPEPLLDPSLIAADGLDPSAAADVSVALLLALERLSPLERAAFILHDVFDVDYAEVAATLERTQAACRQLVTRARENVRAARPRYRPSPEECERAVRAFSVAATTGDTAPLLAVLAEDAVYYSDGGGRVSAARRPILGSERIARFVAGVGKKFPWPEAAGVLPCTVNGMPGLLIVGHLGPLQTLAFELAGGRIAAIYSVRNPDKLRYARGSS
jgi:RNA polymerase sigma-70 factor, ECF subfamily